MSNTCNVKHRQCQTQSLEHVPGARSMGKIPRNRARGPTRDGGCTGTLGLVFTWEDVAGVRPAVMGVVNVTPDSFSDAGRYFAPDAAVAHGLALVASGADLLDVGGESTRPGAEPVPQAEELRRVVPVIARLA